jgi:CyaY protein
MEPGMTQMTESEYTHLADTALNKIEHALEAIEDGVDFERAAGGILEVEFDNGSKIIINKQSATQEIWVAARSGGYHYRWDGAAWSDTRTGEELFAALSGFASAQAGQTIQLSI